MYLHNSAVGLWSRKFQRDEFEYVGKVPALTSGC